MGDFTWARETSTRDFNNSSQTVSNSRRRIFISQIPIAGPVAACLGLAEIIGVPWRSRRPSLHARLEEIVLESLAITVGNSVICYLLFRETVSFLPRGTPRVTRTPVKILYHFR